MNVVYGTPKNRTMEWIRGTGLDDIIFPLGGWDVVDGGGGSDTVVVAGASSLFKLLQEDSGTYIDTVSGASDYAERVQLINVEKIQFTDKVVTLEIPRRWAGRAGDDEYQGGPVLDWLVLDGPRSQYELEPVGSQWRVSDSMGLSGTDSLRSVERVRFSDGVALLTERTWLTQQAHNSYSELPLGLYQFFVVAFGAVPGVTYMNQMAEAHLYKMPLLEMVEIFTTKSQFTDLYDPSLNRLQLAEKLMERIVKTSADASAIQEATDDVQKAMETGWSLGKVIYTVFGNLAAKSPTDPTWGGTARLFQNQVAVAQYATETLNLDTTDIGVLQNLLNGVEADSNTSTPFSTAQLVGMAMDAAGYRDVFDANTPWLTLV